MKWVLATSALALALAGPAAAETWTLEGDASRLAFGSIKNSYTGEVHGFTDLSGSVTDGVAEITIALGSVDTMIDIRDERMIEYVFRNAPSATLTSAVDMEALEALSPGESTVMEIDGTLSFLGADVDLFLSVFAMRIAPDRVLVASNDMLFIATDEIGIDAGVDKLQELATLDDITRAVPVTFRFVFSSDGSSS